MDNLEKLKKEYEELKKEFNLPPFEKLDEEFEIRALKPNESGILLNALLRTIYTKIGYYASLLEPCIAPTHPSFHALIETNNIPDNDKQEMQVFYKQLNKLVHESLYIETQTKKEIAKFINKLSDEFPEIKEKQGNFLKLIYLAWEKEEKKPTKTSYLG